MKAEIIAIGSELVSGQGLDTNSPWLSRELGDRGIAVRYHSTLGDDLDENLAAFRVALGRADLVLVTGGLGPTQDDLTREVLAAVAGVPLVEDPESLRWIEHLFASRQRPMPPRNRVQALVPEGAEALPNPVGTAPGVWLRVERTTFACLPGVPAEMMLMFTEQVAPRLVHEGWVDRVIVHEKLNLFGRGESDIEAEALDLTARGRQPEVGITASDATISFRVSASGRDAAEARATLAPTLALIRERFAPLIVGEGDQDVADGLARELARTGATLALAESCTGGLVGQMLTAIPGISANFLGGVISYSNPAKVDLLGVAADLIAAKGAVSPEVAEAMAEGARLRFGADLALSLTGIAGPEGGTPEKPVGLVYLGLATAGQVASRRLDLGFGRTREFIRRLAAKQALNWARQSLLPRPDRPT